MNRLNVRGVDPLPPKRHNKGMTTHCELIRNGRCHGNHGDRDIQINPRIAMHLIRGINGKADDGR